MVGMMTMMLSNSAQDKAAALAEAEEFGKREGGGAAARAGFYVTLTEVAKAKRGDVADAEQFWDSYAKGASLGASMIGGLKQSTNPEDTRKVRVSECRQFLKLGGLPYVDGCEVLDRGMRIIKQAKLDGRLKGKATDAMIALARAQNDDPGNALDDETIETKIQPKEGAEKVEADALEQVRVKLEGIVKKFEESDEVNDAIAYVAKRISDLGGTTRAQKAARSAAKKAAKGQV